jgi:hypothetical protein
MERNLFPRRSRPSEPIAQLLIGLAPLTTVAGVVGSLCGVQHASALLYWPIGLVVVATACAFRPDRTRTA